MKLEENVAAVDCSRCGGTGRVINQAAVGEQYWKERLAGGYTLRQISDLTGYSIGYLSDLEHGRKDWRLEIRAKYRAALIILAEDRA